MEQIADDFKKSNTPAKGAWMPAEKDAILKDPGELVSLVARPTFHSEMRLRIRSRLLSYDKMTR